MLTYDDLDHFDDRSIAGLFADAALTESADARMRRERMLACLRFCRDVPSAELRDNGLGAARRLLRRAWRSQQRDRRLPPEVLAGTVENALHGLGELTRRPGESAEAASWRHAVEGAIEAAARDGAQAGTALPRLRDALARGEFELGADARLAPLEAALSKFGGASGVEIGIELTLDADGLPGRAYLDLVLACGLWRWSALAGCRIAFDGQETEALAADDGVVAILLAGLAVQNGRAITGWAKATGARQAEAA